tara:strand:+ start:672 stop:1817 length:1146 start_codon:yes stop_codon:yes gene_type:complete
MQKKNTYKFKKIIRVCRTWPSENQNGVGLHAFFYSKYINIPTTIFVKDIKKKDNPVTLANISIKTVNYRDILLKKKKNNILLLLLILITKARGEIIMFLNLIIRTEIKRINNILHIHSANFILSGYLLSFFYKIPIIVQLGGTDILRMEKSIIHKFILKRIIYFICINNEISNKIKRINPKAKTLIVGNSADLSLFKPSKKNKNLFVSVGNLRWQKSYSTLINSFNIFTKKNPKATLLIFGEGPERKKLEHQIKDLHLEDNIFLKGYCTQKEIASTLSKSYIYIQSSISEGMPKSILEGVASGCPIIATNVGSCKELTDKFGIGVKPNNPIDLSEAILKLFINNELWNFYHLECIKNRTKFSWENLVKKVSAFYEEIELIR